MIVRMVYANYSIHYSTTSINRGNCMKEKEEEGHPPRPPMSPYSIETN